MQGILDAILSFWSLLKSVLTTVGVVDALDVLVVAFLLYHTILLVRETRAMQLVKGIAAIMILYIGAEYLNMITLTFIIKTILQWGIVALAIVFQPELRRALEQVGRSKISSFGRRGNGETHGGHQHNFQAMINAVCDSVQSLSDTQTGALIVIEREIKLGDVIDTGTVIDSEPNAALISNIFYPNTPLHDGAMIFRDARIFAAGCFLPLSSNDEIGRDLGTRHRAALGMSEVSDALVVVVSEETGATALALDGKLRRNISVGELRAVLEAVLFGDSGGQKSRVSLWMKEKK